ncbi:MAG: pentapeptide repeat-containing protein [Maritimibacter sp.]
MDTRPARSIQAKFGAETWPPPLFWAVSALWLLFALFVLFGIFHAISEFLGLAPPAKNDAVAMGDLRFLLTRMAALIAVLSAVIAFPFTVIRLRLTARQTSVQELGLATERLNKAIENIGKTREVRKEIRGEIEGVLEPNIEARIGGILSLGRVATENPEYHLEILDILCSYIRANASSIDAKESPHEVFNELTRDRDGTKGFNAEDAFKSGRFRQANTIGVLPTDLNSRNLGIWARASLSSRQDIDLALRIIGERDAKQIKLERVANYKLDLSKSNLQSCVLRGNFDFAVFTDCRLDGATFEGSFRESQFSFYGERAISGASLQAARCHRSDFTGADFSGANLSSVFFGAATLNNCRFRGAALDHTNFNGASVTKSDFAHAKIQNCYCYFEADFTGSRFTGADWSQCKGIDEGPPNVIWQNGEVFVAGHDCEESERARIREVNEKEDRQDWEAWIAENE